MSENSPFLSEQKNAVNIEKNATEKVQFPNSRKIINLTTLIIIITLGLNLCHSWISFDQCKAINNMEPCNFKNKLNFYQINDLKQQINESMEEFNHIGRDGEDNAQKRDKLVKKILNLTEEYNYQKTHHEKCYFGHMEKTYYNIRFYQKMLFYSSVFIVYFVTFPVLCYLYQKGKQSLSLTTANENEKAKVQKVQLTKIVIFLITCSVILGLSFKTEFYLPSNLDANDLFDMPLGMDKNTKCEINEIVTVQLKINGT